MIRRALTVLFWVLSFFVAQAQDSLLPVRSLPADALAPTPTLTLGLALSGGGAKGLAHIGVLKVLEENGIYPDLITGTSMGSIVGGLYAIGYTPAELEEFATKLNWSEFFNDNYPRRLLPVEERSRSDRYLLTLAFRDGKLQLPRGLIRGRKIQALLATLTAPVHMVDTFDQYTLPFATVATNLETGEDVVFHTGALRRAIRASMSIPSIFEPLVVEDQLLVDGLLVRNLPVSDARELGADVVIAVDVGDPLYARKDLTNVLKVLEQTSSFGMASSTEVQRALADMLIDPDLEGFTTLSYDRADSLIARGEAAARAALPTLLHRLDSLGIDLPRPAFERPKRLQRDSFLITEASFEADNPNTRRVLEQLFPSRLPRLFTAQDLGNLVGRLYGTGFFDLVDYALLPVEGEEGAYRILLTASRGPRTYLRAGINYDSNYKAAMLLNLTSRGVGFRNGVLAVDLRIGENPGLFFDYLVYTRSNPSIGFKTNLRAFLYPGRIYEDAQLTSEFKFHQYLAELSLFSGFGRNWMLETGVLAEHLSQNPKFFEFDRSDTRLQRYALQMIFSRDTYDRANFARRGSRTELRAEYTLGGNIALRSNETQVVDQSENLLLSGHLHKVLPVGKRLWLDWFAGAGVVNYRERSLINLFYLGRDLPGQDRFFEVFGLRYMEQPATGFGFAGLKVRAELGKDNFVGLAYNIGYYLLSEYALVTDSTTFNRPEEEGHFSGLGLELGSITAFGPLRFTTEYNMLTNRFNFMLYAGYRF